MGAEMKEKFEQWAVVELMGHVRMAGRVTEEERFGTVMGRIDIPGDGDRFTTQFFNGSSVYRLTPVSEEAARSMAKHHQPRPVLEWELPQLQGGKGDESIDDDDEDMPW